MEATAGPSPSSARSCGFFFTSDADVDIGNMVGTDVTVEKGEAGEEEASIWAQVVGKAMARSDVRGARFSCRCQGVPDIS